MAKAEPRASADVEEVAVSEVETVKESTVSMADFEALKAKVNALDSAVFGASAQPL